MGYPRKGCLPWAGGYEIPTTLEAPRVARSGLQADHCQIVPRLPSPGHAEKGVAALHRCRQLACTSAGLRTPAQPRREAIRVAVPALFGYDNPS
jgi:hypothetical protein